MQKNNKIYFLGDGRDFHALDWFHSGQNEFPNYQFIYITDLIESENVKKIIKINDIIIHLFNIDWILFKQPSIIGHKWRNIIKMLFIPLQAMLLKRIIKKYKIKTIYAQTMSYMAICKLAKIEYIGTPQGSEILVRPSKSIFYKYFAQKAISSAKALTVDSLAMKMIIQSWGYSPVYILQNGIDTNKFYKINNKNYNRGKITSFRGIDSLYRIDKILEARNNSLPKVGIDFVYPFSEKYYHNSISGQLLKIDRDLGRLNRDELMELFYDTKLAISIPKSDSSPRSVYEAIFSGCCVALTNALYIDDLPRCMKDRIYIVDLDDKLWFKKALKFAENVTKDTFIPTKDALSRFNQRESIKWLINKFN